MGNARAGADTVRGRKRRRARRSASLTALLLASLVAGHASAQTAGASLVGMGDSLGEGVQAADAAWQTQIFGYLTWISLLRGTPVAPPYIGSSFIGLVGSTDGRQRLFPSQVSSNVAVSGATVVSLLDEAADAISTGAIDSESDLILFPRRQSQMGYVESAAPGLVVCWVGNNNALPAATAIGGLDASQLSSLAEFDADFTRLADRFETLIAAHGTRVVFANIPDVTDIAFLVDRATAESITGFPVDLPPGSLTSLVSTIAMKFLGNDLLMRNPDFVLDSGELTTIRGRIAQFNAVIAREAERLGMPVVDVHAKFKELVANPPVILGFPLTKRPFGGLFSLDGVHPSNTGHALIANEFLTAINRAFGESNPLVPPEVLTALFLTDPHIDKNGDGRVAGRLGVGLVETLAFLIGLTGDLDEL